MNSAIPLKFATYDEYRSRPRRRSYWKTRSEKLRDRLESEQEFYSERRYEWLIEQELYAERRQRQQIDERAAISELGMDPEAIGLTASVLPVLRGTGVLPIS